jgi:hypothetical protein
MENRLKIEGKGHCWKYRSVIAKALRRTATAETRNELTQPECGDGEASQSGSERRETERKF